CHVPFFCSISICCASMLDFPSSSLSTEYLPLTSSLVDRLLFFIFMALADVIVLRRLSSSSIFPGRSSSAVNLSSPIMQRIPSTTGFSAIVVDVGRKRRVVTLLFVCWKRASIEKHGQ